MLIYHICVYLALQPQVPVVVDICNKKKKKIRNTVITLILMEPEDVSKSYTIKG